jgi:o-succinylbenzoate---CoA ligase
LLFLSPSQLPEPSPDWSDYERETWHFCHDWQEGKSSFVLHTSGSTGQPKPIVLSRQQMLASARLTGQALNLQPGDQALVCLNTRYIAGTMMLVRGLELGMDMSVVAPSANPLLDLPDDMPIDFTALVPLQLQTILTQTPEKMALLNRCKAILVGGAPVNAQLEEQLQVITAPVLSTYGMTETVSHVALRRLNGSERSETYTALPGVQLGVDQRGCLQITAPMTDYQCLQTNDLVALTRPNTFRWLGRADNVINSGGIKIHPERIESQLDKILLALKRPSRLIAFGMPDPALGEMLCVAIEGASWSPAIENQVKKQLATLVNRYDMPRRFFFLASFPETPTGKIDRQQIRLMIAQQSQQQ